MSANADFRIAVAEASHAAALCRLFEQSGTACHCEWWHFDGDKNAWLDRLAHRPLDNREALVERLASDRLRPQGLLALEDKGTAIGWMKLTRSDAVPKLYAQRVYRSLPCFTGDRSGVLTIGCFLVDEAHRRRGVASALLAAGIAHAKESGARVIEAFPRVGENLRDEEIWTGPRSLFARFGFEPVAGLAPYPVLVKRLMSG